MFSVAKEDGGDSGVAEQLDSTVLEWLDLDVPSITFIPAFHGTSDTWTLPCRRQTISDASPRQLVRERQANHSATDDDEIRHADSQRMTNDQIPMTNETSNPNDQDSPTITALSRGSIHVEPWHSDI